MSNPSVRLSVELPAANVSDLICGSWEQACGSSLTASFSVDENVFFPTDEEELDGQVFKVCMYFCT